MVALTFYVTLIAKTQRQTLRGTRSHSGAELQFTPSGVVHLTLALSMLQNAIQDG
jgi:hypothetical protein